MSMNFTKLFSSITASTIWTEDSDTRVLWVTMLAMADKRGRVFASIPGLANIAQVPIPACERAIERFLAPDKYSRTQDREGRRIEPHEEGGGWRLINYVKYRETRDAEETKAYNREWMRKHREKKDVAQ